MDPQERKRQILDRAAEVFAAKGVASTTVRQIADAVGVYSGTLYHYFPSKEAIVVEIIREYFQDLEQRFGAVQAGDPDPLTRLRMLVLAALEAGRNHPHATRIWQNEPDYMQERMVESGLGDEGAEIEGIWSETIVAGVEAGTFRDDIDPEVFRMLIRNAVWMTSQWYVPSDAVPLEKMAADITTVFVDGFHRPA
ncbi:TetR/AcrR family transcriptional regulator [Rhodococcus sp. NPDC003348]